MSLIMFSVFSSHKFDTFNSNVCLVKWFGEIYSLEMELPFMAGKSNPSK